MKHVYIIFGIIVLIIIGMWLLFAPSNRVQAPEVTTESTNTAPVDNTLDISVDTNVEAPLTVKEFTVTAKNFSFVPSTMKVKKGDKVKITFVNNDGFHDLKIDEFKVASKQTKAPSTEVLEFTADKSGSFQYYCSVGSHRAMGMWGTLTVE